MWLVRGALRRPLTILVLVLALLAGAALTLRRMPADIFPTLGVPVVYVVQPYAGMSPSQMEGQLVGYYEYHFLYINGIEHIESTSIQGMGMVKLYFHPGTDIAQSMAQVTAMAFRATSFMPPGTLPPFISSICLRYRTPPSTFCSGSSISLTPKSLAVPGISCIGPRAPAELTH